MIAGPGVFHGTGVDPVSDPAAFVAEADGFSSAATRMGVATAGVSKAVLRPEDRLGLRLSTRTTRRVRPTTDGERFPPQARAILAEVDAEPREGALRLEGRVRVDAPVIYGARVLAPCLGALHRAHPGPAVELHFADEVRDPIESGAGLAVRFGTRVPDRMIRRRLRTTRWWTAASPAHLMCAARLYGPKTSVVTGPSPTSTAPQGARIAGTLKAPPSIRRRACRWVTASRIGASCSADWGWGRTSRRGG